MHPRVRLILMLVGMAGLAWFIATLPSSVVITVAFATKPTPRVFALAMGGTPSAHLAHAYR